MSNSFVQKMTRFAELSIADHSALTEATAQPRQYAAKQDLIREGDETGAVFVMLEGWACRYKILPTGTRQITAFLMAGDACDLNIWMLDVMDHGIQAITSAQLAIVPKPTMQALMAQHPNIARAMYTAQLIDEGVLRAWIVSMGRRTSIERVAHLMCELYLRAGTIGMLNIEPLAVPLSQLVLADALGMTPVHVNRILKSLRLTGAMAVKRGSLIIQDPVMLIQIAGFDENYLHRRLARLQ